MKLLLSVVQFLLTSPTEVHKTIVTKIINQIKRIPIDQLKCQNNDLVVTRDGSCVVVALKSQSVMGLRENVLCFMRVRSNGE